MSHKPHILTSKNEDPTQDIGLRILSKEHQLQLRGLVLSAKQVTSMTKIQGEFFFFSNQRRKFD